MNFLARFLVATFYVAALPLHVLQKWSGFDRLRLRRSPESNTYWVERKISPDLQSYFKESSVAEGLAEERGVAWCITPLLRLLAKAYAPPRDISRGQSSAADREQGIPDEIYTLW